VAAIGLILGAGGVPSEPAGAAQGRGYGVLHITGPAVPGPLTHPALGAGGIRVLDFRLSLQASPNSSDPNDPWAIAPEFSELIITKEVDKASPLLYLYGATGQHFGYVMLRLLEAGATGDPYQEIILEDAVIAGVTNRMVYRPTGDYAHLEDVAFRYTMIRWTSLTGGTTAAWDLVENQGL